MKETDPDKTGLYNHIIKMQRDMVQKQVPVLPVQRNILLDMRFFSFLTPHLTDFIHLFLKV